VTLKLKSNAEMSKHVAFGSAKGFWPIIFAQFAEGGKGHSKA
jgi:hypothetical protein